MTDAGGLNSIAKSEHISPDSTGDNIGAKKTAGYGYDSANQVWRRIAVDANGNTQIGGTITATVDESTLATSANQTNGNQKALINNDNLYFKDNFNGVAIDSTKWTVTQAPASTTSYSIANSILTINADVTANDYIVFTSKQTYTLPLRVQVLFSLSQRIANNNFYIEIVNAAGTTATAFATTAVSPGVTQAAYAFSGTTATNGTVVAQNQGVKAAADATVTVNTTASYGGIEIAATADFVEYGTRTADGAANIGNAAARNRTILDPAEQYFIQIRSLNGGSVPATNTALTIESVMVQDNTATAVEITGGRGDISSQRATGVNIQSGTVATVTNGNLGFPSIIADVASAAITSTATTSAFTPTFGSAFKINIPVTAVAGTNPTLDIEVQESRDSGTNWVTIYEFPQITATGSYNSPTFVSLGNRYRYVQTITGSAGQSFTRAINRFQLSSMGTYTRQLIDNAARSTININSLNSTTANLPADNNTNNVQLVVKVGAITTTAPQFQIEGSDDNGGTWYSVGSPLTAVASSTVQLTVNNVTAQLFRARVSTAGSGATAGYVLLRAF